MRKHIGVWAGLGTVALGLVLAIAALAGFSVGLPAVHPVTTLGPSWFLVAEGVMLLGAFVAFAARGVELDAEERTPVRIPRPVRRLHPTR